MLYSGVRTPEYYMSQGKKLKHDGDATYNSRPPGRLSDKEAANRALLYFEASLNFIMAGWAVEHDYNNGKSL